MRALKNTKTRRAVINCLTKPNEAYDPPPHSARTIFEMLETQYEYYGAKKPVAISQINRTLRDLNEAKLISGKSRLIEPEGKGLPKRVMFWQYNHQIKQELGEGK